MSNAYQYEPLTPKLIDNDDKKFQVYRNALNQAYSKDEIKNIAITGIYGSGKSSVWKTYQHEKINSNSDKWNGKSVITVALSEFKEEIDGKPGNKIDKQAIKEKINNVEEQIINQILYQIDADKIPLSKYEIKNSSDKNITVRYFIKAFFFILGVFLLLSINEVSAFFPEEKQPWIGLIATFFALSALIIPVLNEVKKTMNKYKIYFTKISFQGNSLDLKDTKRDVLNDEMRELVYIITASDVHTLVFEDLDRFDNLDLLVKLRELNYLINANANHVIRFVYLLRDDLFLQQDRTKFFDLIIPIVPVINSQNSIGKLLKLFRNLEEDSFMPETWVIESISLYVDDMRLLYSIRNEFEVYSKAIDAAGRKLNPNKLLGMIVFKNVFPKEFDQFQQDKGYVYKLIENLERIRQNYLANTNSKLTDLRSSLKELQLLTANSKFELMALQIPSSTRVYNVQGNPLWSKFLKEWSEKPDENYQIRYGGSSNNQDYNNFSKNYFSDDKFQRKLKLFKDLEKSEAIKQYINEIRILEDNLNQIHAMPMNEILTQISAEGLEEFFIIKKEDKIENGGQEKNVIMGVKDVDLDLPSNHYFGLIRFLFYEGLLDETYPDYLGHFYASTIGLKDEIFIRKLRDGTGSDELFELDNPKTVKSKLIKRDYKKKGIYNHSLINAILDEKDTTNLATIIAVTLNNDIKVDSMLSFLDSLDEELITQVVKSLFIEDFDLYWKLLNRTVPVQTLHDKLLVEALQNIELLNDDKEQSNKFKEYTKTISHLLEKSELLENDSFYIGLEKINVKFDDIVEFDINPVVASKIEKKALYRINIPNIAAIYHQITGTPYVDSMKKLLHLLDMDDVLKVTKSRMDEDVDFYTKEFIEVAKQLDILPESTQETFIKILNKEISSETKKQLIMIEQAVISDLNKIEDKNLWSTLLENYKIKFTQENINIYFGIYGSEDALIEFLNYSSVNNNFDISNTDLANKIIQNENLNDDVFKVVLKRSDSQIESINSELQNKENRINLFIQEHKLTLTKENYLAIQNLENKEILIKYLNQFKSELDSFIGTTMPMIEVTDDAFTAIINSNILESKQSIAIISQRQKKISLMAVPNAKYEIRKHIFHNNLEDDDLQKIIDSIKNFDLMDDFITRMNREQAFLESVLEKNLNMDFIGALMKDSNLSESNKIRILTKLVEIEKYAKYWKKLMLSSSSEKLLTLAQVFDNTKHPDYPTDSLIKILVDSLIKLKVITLGKNDKLYFNNKEFENIKTTVVRLKVNNKKT